MCARKSVYFHKKDKENVKVKGKKNTSQIHKETKIERETKDEIQIKGKET